MAIDQDTIDLPKRLRRFSGDKSFNLGAVPSHLLDEAAAEIDRLREERVSGIDDDDDYRPDVQTKRFDVFLQRVVRNPALGVGRDVFTAWFRDEDVPRPVCVVTLFCNYVEWIQVCEHYRRRGIATEVLEGIEAIYGVMSMDGVTDAGEAFVEAYCKSHDTDVTEEEG